MSEPAKKEIPSNAARFFPQPYPSAPCDIFNCRARAKWFIGKPKPSDTWNQCLRVCDSHAREILENLPEELEGHVAAVSEMEEHLDLVYSERNKCVALLVRMALALGLTAGIGKHEGKGDWDPEWMNVVFIDLPAGQVSWHIHDSELPMFDFLPPYPGRWDGHDTAEKYRRVLDPGIFRPPEQTAAPEESRSAAGGYSCPYCGEVFQTPRAMGGHKGSCAKKPSKGE